MVVTPALKYGADWICVQPAPAPTQANREAAARAEVVRRTAEANEAWERSHNQATPGRPQAGPASQKEH
jgi:hypothetical protein